MRWKQIENEPKTFVLIFETGDEIASVLQQFADGQRLGASSFKAIGALSHATLGWFNWETKKYDPACILDEQVELVSLIGDIALRDGEPQVHAHMVVGGSDGTAYVPPHVPFVAGRDRSADEGAAGTHAARIDSDNHERVWTGNAGVEAGSEWKGRHDGAQADESERLKC